MFFVFFFKKEIIALIMRQLLLRPILEVKGEIGELLLSSYMYIELYMY